MFKKKQRKVKRYRNIYRGSLTSSPFFKLGVSAAVLAALIAAGWFLYEPVYQFVMSLGQEKEPTSSSEPAADPGPGLSEALPGFLEEEETDTSQSQSEPEAAAPVNGVYMPEFILLDSAQRAAFIQSCSANGINAIFFDLKNDKGVLTYRSSLGQVA